MCRHSVSRKQPFTRDLDIPSSSSVKFPTADPTENTSQVIPLIHKHINQLEFIISLASNKLDTHSDRAYSDSITMPSHNDYYVDDDDDDDDATMLCQINVRSKAGS